MNRLRVLMVDLKSDLFSPPYHLGLLVAYALQEREVAHNICFTFQPHARRQPADEIAKHILAFEADLVAISNYAWNYKTLGGVLDALAAASVPLPRIVLGGPNCAGRFGADMLQRFPVVSCMVEGEGEPAFRDICLSLADDPSRDPFIHARNCRIRDENDVILQPNLGHRIKHLDDVPSPYLTGLLPVEPPPVFYETNRGCPYRCAFCYWGNGNATIYRMSHDRIREEMTYFARHHVSSFIFADANFGIFESDAEIAELLATINAEHGYPFKFLSVNYAKNSSERVLEIASTLRKGKIHTATTLALQSVTPEAEKQAKRYAIDAGKFVGLVRGATKKQIATYTDLILGLPGESIDEFLSGLCAAIATGVPAIKIYQLSLLPGTDFYDKQEEFGLVLMPKADIPPVPPEQRSEFWEFLVSSHPRMPYRDMQRGLRTIGINHLLHNLNLGQIVNSYLARYDVTARDVYDFFDDLILLRIPDFEDPSGGFLSRVRELTLHFAAARIDGFTFEASLADEVWFRGRGVRGAPNNAEVTAFVHHFYGALCRRRGITLSSEEARILDAIVEYNMLISPKPRWKPQSEYRFTYDVDAIANDVAEAIATAANGDDPTEWANLAQRATTRLQVLLSDEYLTSKRVPTVYTVENPMLFLPPKMKMAWAVSNRDWFCRIQRAGQ